MQKPNVRGILGGICLRLGLFVSALTGAALVLDIFLPQPGSEISRTFELALGGLAFWLFGCALNEEKFVIAFQKSGAILLTLFAGWLAFFRVGVHVSAQNFAMPPIEMAIISIGTAIFWVGFWKIHRRIGRLTPYQAVCQWHQKQPELFHKQPTELLAYRSQPEGT